MKVKIDEDKPLLVIPIDKTVDGNPIACTCGKPATGAVCIPLQKTTWKRNAFYMVPLCDDCGRLVTEKTLAEKWQGEKAASWAMSGGGVA